MTSGLPLSAIMSETSNSAAAETSSGKPGDEASALGVRISGLLEAIIAKTKETSADAPEVKPTPPLPRRAGRGAKDHEAVKRKEAVREAELQKMLLRNQLFRDESSPRYRYLCFKPKHFPVRYGTQLNIYMEYLGLRSDFGVAEICCCSHQIATREWGKIYGFGNILNSLFLFCNLKFIRIKI